jgi:hypothetical protein
MTEGALNKQLRSTIPLICSVATVLFATVPVFAAGGESPAAFDGTKSATAARATSRWTVPRTPWGDPDLQGLWPSIDMQGTPYERPSELAGQAVLDDKEFAARSATQNARRRGWGELGVPSRQASLIVEPADGRLPPLTPEGQARFATARSTYYLDFPDVVTPARWE